MSQHMALYFDSRAEKAIADSVSSIGQTLGSNAGVMGIGGIVGGMLGGPLGAVFGAAAASMGSSLLGNVLGKLAGFFGSIIGAATGFIWNSGGINSLRDSQKRQLPGFMCLLPKDKPPIYLKPLFHMSGQNHARIPFNHFTTAENYPDKLAAVLGKSEISFT